MTVQAPPPRTPTSLTPPETVDGLQEWWITYSHRLPVDKRNGWVVAAAIEEFIKEDAIAKACDKANFTTRVREAGLGELVAGDRKSVV